MQCFWLSISIQVHDDTPAQCSSNANVVHLWQMLSRACLLHQNNSLNVKHVGPETCTFSMLQVESVQLSRESAHKQLELELANAKHNAAQAAAAHKSAAASWQGELDWQKSEVLLKNPAFSETLLSMMPIKGMQDTSLACTKGHLLANHAYMVENLGGFSKHLKTVHHWSSLS